MLYDDSLHHLTLTVSKLTLLSVRKGRWLLFRLSDLLLYKQYNQRPILSFQKCSGSILKMHRTQSQYGISKRAPDHEECHLTGS